MRFKGQLLLPSEGGPGLPVDLEVADHHLALVSEQEELGAWPLEAVNARRLRGDTFAITVAGEDLHFVADDTISFAYSGMPHIQRFARPSRTRSPLRALLGLFWQDTTKVHDAPEAAPKPSTEESPPHRPIPDEAKTQFPGLDSPFLPDPLPELGDPSSADFEIPESRISADDDLTLPLDPEHPTEQPSVDFPSPQQVIDTTSGTVPPAERNDIEVNTIEPLDQDPPQENVATASRVETIRCPALRHDGLPCQSPVIGPSGYCYPHDPERPLGQGVRQAQEARARLIRKGTSRLTRVYSRLDKALRQVERGELDPAKAMAMAQLARTMCAILELDEEPTIDSGEDI